MITKMVTEELIDSLINVVGDELSFEVAVVLSDSWATYAENPVGLKVVTKDVLLDSCRLSCAKLSCPDLTGVIYILLSNAVYRDKLVRWASNVIVENNTQDKDIFMAESLPERARAD